MPRGQKMAATALGLTTAQAALMTSLPVLLFALAAPLAARLGRRLGPGRAVLVGLALIGVGTLVREVGGPLVLLLGTAVVGQPTSQQVTLTNNAAAGGANITIDPAALHPAKGAEPK